MSSPWSVPAKLLTIVASIDAAMMIAVLAYTAMGITDAWQLVGTFGLVSLLALGVWRTCLSPLKGDESWDETGETRRAILATAFMLGAHYFSDGIVHAQKVGENIEALTTRFSANLREYHDSALGSLLENAQFYFWTGNFTNKGLWIVLALAGVALAIRLLGTSRRRLCIAIALAAGLAATYLLVAMWSSLIVLGQPIDSVEHWPVPDSF